MRSLHLVLLLSFSLSAHASWFGGSSSASSLPAQASAWTADQYNKAQQAFQGLKADAFDSWDESRLREFLLEQGVVEPKGTREQLALLAKQKYHAYSSFASKSATSLISQASRTASTAVYGDSMHQASKSISSTYAQATNDASRKLEDSKDYVYSTWDDNRLRSYLESKGVIKTKQQASRDELLSKMRETYARTTNPFWQAWSDSYMREWLVNHGLLRSEEQKTRDELSTSMNKYYYHPKDTAYSHWTDSDMRSWLVSQGVLKSDAQMERDKLATLLQQHYADARDTVWSAWGDSDMRTWLVEHGYIDDRTAAGKKRDELVKLMQEKYNDYSARTAPYLVWPDARLRAYLREHGMSESALPTSRPTLLQEVRIRWVQTQSRAEWLYARVKELVLSGVENAEEKLNMILDMLMGHAEGAKARAGEKYDDAKGYANEKSGDAAEYAKKKGKDAWGYAAEKGEDAKGYAAEKGRDAKGYAADKAADASDYAAQKATDAKAKAGEKKGAAESAGRRYWNEKLGQVQRKAEEAKVEL